MRIGLHQPLELVELSAPDPLVEIVGTDFANDVIIASNERFVHEPVPRRFSFVPSSTKLIEVVGPTSICNVPAGGISMMLDPGGGFVIGLGRVTRIIEDIKVDKPYLIPDEEAVPLIFDLAEHEGLCMGGSTGINVAGAIRLARDMGPGHTVVTILADGGSRYLSKLFNPRFLRDKGLPVPDWLERRMNVQVPYEKT